MKIPMVLHKEIFFMRFYLVFMLAFAFPHVSHGNRSNSSIKSMIVQEIMRKVSNITLHSLSNATAEKKETVLTKIENKLRQSAKSMGADANKYVKFIMEEFKTKAFNDKLNRTAAAPQPNPNISIRSNGPVSRTGIDSDTKQQIVREIADKIQSLAKGFMKNAKTIESKKAVLEKIRKRIMESAKHKHMQIHNKHEELKAYSSLIAKGLEVSMRKMMDEETNSRRMQPDSDNKAETVVTTSTPAPVTEEDDIKVKDHPTDEEIAKKSSFMFDINEINKYKELIAESLNDTSIDPRCDEIVEETCLNIQAFNKISCGDGKSVPIEYLCNGAIDCWNHSDEENCTFQAIEKVRKATAVMTDIEASMNRQCFASTSEGSILTSQNQILRDVLNTQMEFLQSHFETTPAEHNTTDNKKKDKSEEDDSFIKRTVGDVNLILSTLSYALDGTLCAQHIDPYRTGNMVARKYNDIEVEELDDGPRDPGWSPKSCTCKKQFCDSKKCDAQCKRVCWQKHSLNHWGCQAINGGTSVSLNTICDGKFDCFDETDESNCAIVSKHSKFDASSTYSHLLDLLSTKSKSFEFSKSRNKVVELLGLVRQLQKQTMKTNTDPHVIKLLRDDTFNMLVSIYEDLLQTTPIQELDDAYLTLLSINEKLISALKATHAGNENLISPAGCYCRGGLCALRRCTKNCVQACLAEPVLTRYACNVQNVTVPVETVCNGKNNCPNGEDEKNCAKDICRSHHLVVLRHNLQNVGAKHKGTVLGEVIETWRIKVSAALHIAETADRPNHKTMSHIISRVLRDLVMAFAAMEDYRRTNSDYALKEFIGISKIVMNTMKSCKN